MKTGTWIGLVGMISLGCMAGSASADVIFTFGYTDLSGSFDGESTFTAEAVDLPGLRSAGDVTRLVDPAGSANFDDGFVSRSDHAGVAISIDVTDIGEASASGAGEFLLTDADGDRISGAISGLWSTPGLGALVFSGVLSEVTLIDTGIQDGTFDGVDGGEMLMDFSPASEPFEGAIVQLLLPLGAPGFFGAPFEGVSTLVSAEIVPTPGSAALLMLGGLAAWRRRR